MFSVPGWGISGYKDGSCCGFAVSGLSISGSKSSNWFNDNVVNAESHPRRITEKAILSINIPISHSLFDRPVREIMYTLNGGNW